MISHNLSWLCHKLLPTLSSKHQAIHQTMGEIFSPTGNYKAYRKLLEDSKPPLIPFEGVYLSDFTFMEEIPTFISPGNINFSKIEICGSLLSQIRYYGKLTYDLEAIPYFADYWRQIKQPSQAELHKARNLCKIQFEEDEKQNRSLFPAASTATTLRIKFKITSTMS
jgi:hypothetical protein